MKTTITTTTTTDIYGLKTITETVVRENEHRNSENIDGTPIITENYTVTDHALGGRAAQLEASMIAADDIEYNKIVKRVIDTLTDEQDDDGVRVVHPDLPGMLILLTAIVTQKIKLAARLREGGAK